MNEEVCLEVLEEALENMRKQVTKVRIVRDALKCKTRREKFEKKLEEEKKNVKQE